MLSSSRGYRPYHTFGLTEAISEIEHSLEAAIAEANNGIATAIAGFVGDCKTRDEVLRLQEIALAINEAISDSNRYHDADDWMQNCYFDSALDNFDESEENAKLEDAAHRANGTTGRGADNYLYRLAERQGFRPSDEQANAIRSFVAMNETYHDQLSFSALIGAASAATHGHITETQAWATADAMIDLAIFDQPTTTTNSKEQQS